jgi:hypothetical protein
MTSISFYCGLLVKINKRSFVHLDSIKKLNLPFSNLIFLIRTLFNKFVLFLGVSLWAESHD